MEQGLLRINPKQFLKKLLIYDNPAVISQFLAKNGQYNQVQVQQFFSDLLRWLFLKELRSHTGKKTYLFGPLLILDDIWHIFILHTREYFHFCENFFGAYVHHEVEPIGQEHHLTADELADFLQDSFEFLGEAWVKRYFGLLLETN